MLRIFTLLLFVVIANSALAQQDKFKQPTPDWINTVTIPEVADSLDGGGSQYLLYENQVNFSLEQSYFRHAIALNSSESLTDYSRLSFDYDPSYQSFTFHKVAIYRDGEYLDKLANHIVNTFHRETSMERSIYDGSLTAVIDLSDVRKGDVLVYSYSFTGRNKAFPNHIYDYQRLQFGSPLGRLYYRLIGPKDELKYKLHNGAKPPLRVFHGNELDLIWDKSGIIAKQYFSNTPSWYNNTERVTVSNFDSWSDVLTSVLPYYELSSSDKGFLKGISKEFYDKDEEQQVLNAIQFVQDDIRYLGFEDGIHAFKPHKVEDIYNQRFGDCKDKSFLLSGILTSMGYEAFPVLVNTNTRKSLNKGAISPYSFNHCVVKLRYHEEDVYIDPTWNEQGGNLLSYTFPSYGYGLVLSPSINGLDSIPNHFKASTYVIDEFIIPKDDDEEGTFIVQTEYHGADADDIRIYLGNNSQEDIKKDYVNFYGSVYSGIRILGDIQHEGTLEKFKQMLFGFMNAVMDAWDTLPKEKVQVYPVDGTLNLGGSDWQVIYAPGHTNMQTCFYQAEKKWLIGADMLLSITPTPVIEFSLTDSDKRENGLATMLQSYQKMLDLDIEKVFPGHYEPFGNHRKLIQNQLRRIHLRKEATCQLIADGKTRFYELFDVLYTNRLNMPGMSMLRGYLDLLIDENRIEERMEGGYTAYRVIGD